MKFNKKNKVSFIPLFFSFKSSTPFFRKKELMIEADIRNPIILDGLIERYYAEIPFFKFKQIENILKNSSDISIFSAIKK